MENINEKRLGVRLLEVIILIIVTITLGVAVGVGIVFFNINIQNLKTCEGIDIADDNIREIVNTYQSIIDNYYIDVDKNKLTDSAIRAMLEALGDPHSLFMNEEQTTSFDDRMRGDYYGIGAEISHDKDGNIMILKVFDGSPAKIIGILPHDIIKAVNGESTQGLTTMEVASKLKGPIGTSVNATILRGNEEKHFTIVRNRIIIPSIQSDLLVLNNKKIGYVKVDIFSNNTYDQFRSSVINLEQNNIDSLIIDVRNNSGGYLNRVTEIISMFLPKDKLIYQLQDKETTEKIYSISDETRDYPIVVLINEFSASASEIMAAAFKESYNATIVGVNSVGKGTVQQTFRLETGGMIKYTIQKWLTPNGNWINEIGLTPDITIQQAEEYRNNPTVDNDLQLQKAKEVLGS